MSIFKNAVYEQQRINIENLYNKNPDDWFYKSQMEKPPEARIGFAPGMASVTTVAETLPKAKKGITLDDLGSYIITGCPYCHISYCD